MDIELLKEIFINLHGNNYVIDLKKIVRQKFASYTKKTLDSFNFSYNKRKLELLMEKGYLELLENNEVMLLPLGYAYIKNDFSELTDYNDFECLKDIYYELHEQIVEPLKKDNLSELDCALGFLLLLSGCVSREEGFPFIKKDGNSYEYFEAIRENIDYISYRLNYMNSTPKKVKDGVMFRNILGRNSKNGNLKKRTKIHMVESERASGTTFHWFDLKLIDGELNNVLDNLLEKSDLIGLLNLKKIAMDNLIVNRFSYELKEKIGERIHREKISKEIIEYINEKVLVLNINKENKNITFKLSYESSYEDVCHAFDQLTAYINQYPDEGINLVELHYNLSLIKSRFENEKDALLFRFIDSVGNDLLGEIKRAEYLINN